MNRLFKVVSIYIAHCYCPWFVACNKSWPTTAVHRAQGLLISWSRGRGRDALGSVGDCRGSPEDIDMDMEIVEIKALPKGRYTRK
jgi:hypothetical protein